MSPRVRNAKVQRRSAKMLDPCVHGRKRLKIAEKSAKSAQETFLQFDCDAWAALIDEQRRLIAEAAGIDPAKVKICVGH
jgi:hypothetical protein